MSDVSTGREIVTVEEVDAILVTDARPLPARRTGGGQVAAQAAVVTGSFVAGIATAAVVAHRRGRKTAKRSAKKGARGKSLDVVGTRSFLVDVHLLSRD